MSSAPLAGKKVAVLMESEYIPYEIRAYREQFPALGAEVHFIARLYWPGMDAALMRQALTVHAEQVIPAARDRAGRGAGGAQT